MHPPSTALAMVLADPPPWCRLVFRKHPAKPQMTENTVECAVAERETGHADFATRRFARSRHAKGADRSRRLRIRLRFLSFLILAGAGRSLEGSVPFMQRPPMQLHGKRVGSSWTTGKRASPERCWVGGRDSFADSMGDARCGPTRLRLRWTRTSLRPPCARPLRRTSRLRGLA